LGIALAGVAFKRLHKWLIRHAGRNFWIAVANQRQSTPPGYETRELLAQGGLAYPRFTGEHDQRTMTRRRGLECRLQFPRLYLTADEQRALLG
jgi:hypothetical protein